MPSVNEGKFALHLIERHQILTKEVAQTRIKVILGKKLFNPLQPNANYSYRIIKISFFKRERIMEKLSNEHCVYESVDDESTES